MNTTVDAVLDCLDKEACAINLTGLVAMLPDYQSFEIKDAVGELFDAGRIHRIPTMGPNKRYYTYLSLYVQTVNGCKPSIAEPSVDSVAELTTEQALAVLERAGWRPEPEVVEVERRVIERRTARFGIMDVIDRWKLNFRLSRIIEIVGSARNRKLTKEDADTVSRMIQQHVKEAANG